MTITTQAIEAASRILSATWTGEKEYSDTFDEARDILTAALPALEQQIREQVAAEILAMPNNYPAGPRNIYTRAQQDAAQIARGKERA